MNLSRRAYARHRGVTLQAVQKAIKAGRISVTPEGNIDPVAADADWERNTSPRPSQAGSQHRLPQAPAPQPRAAAAQPAFEPGPAMEFARARAVRETYRARTDKINFEARTGALVSADEVKIAAYARFRQFRDRMLNIPDRLSAELAAESEAARVHEMLSGEIRIALTEFSDADG